MNLLSQALASLRSLLPIFAPRRQPFGNTQRHRCRLILEPLESRTLLSAHLAAAPASVGSPQQSISRTASQQPQPPPAVTPADFFTRVTRVTLQSANVILCPNRSIQYLVVPWEDNHPFQPINPSKFAFVQNGGTISLEFSYDSFPGKPVSHQVLNEAVSELGTKAGTLRMKSDGELGINPRGVYSVGVKVTVTVTDAQGHQRQFVSDPVLATRMPMQSRECQRKSKFDGFYKGGFTGTIIVGTTSAGPFFPGGPTLFVPVYQPVSDDLTFEVIHGRVNGDPRRRALIDVRGNAGFPTEALGGAEFLGRFHERPGGRIIAGGIWVPENGGELGVSGNWSAVRVARLNQVSSPLLA